MKVSQGYCGKNSIEWQRPNMDVQNVKREFQQPGLVDTTAAGLIESRSSDLGLFGNDDIDLPFDGFLETDLVLPNLNLCRALVDAAFSPRRSMSATECTQCSFCIDASNLGLHVNDSESLIFVSGEGFFSLAQQCKLLSSQRIDRRYQHDYGEYSDDIRTWDRNGETGGGFVKVIGVWVISLDTFQRLARLPSGEPFPISKIELMIGKPCILLRDLALRPGCSDSPELGAGRAVNDYNSVLCATTSKIERNQVTLSLELEFIPKFSSLGFLKVFENRKLKQLLMMTQMQPATEGVEHCHNLLSSEFLTLMRIELRKHEQATGIGSWIAIPYLHNVTPLKTSNVEEANGHFQPAKYAIVKARNKLFKEDPLRWNNADESAIWAEIRKRLGYCIPADRWGRPYDERDSQTQRMATWFHVCQDKKVVIQGDIVGLGSSSRFPSLYDCLACIFSLLVPSIERVYAYARSLSFVDNLSNTEPVSLHNDHQMIHPWVRYPDRVFDSQLVSGGYTSLQVITNVRTIQLQPEQSIEFDWSMSGMPHEHIAVVCFCLLRQDDGLSGGELQFKRSWDIKEAEFLSEQLDETCDEYTADVLNESVHPIGTADIRHGQAVVYSNSHTMKRATLSNRSSVVATETILSFFVVDPEFRILSTMEITNL